ncbi:dihydrodipicolinate synthase family protein [Actinotignum sp. GS-2025e]|uniref:dihydrodipicolinate synthase family protein n=1 Tax=Actinotignum TaxID=1653174 RepID=UPI0004D19370|nr:dihydrodipicolinate synthase family protein [Actinotignum schaalii]AIE83026.1 dihydrodipicolinate synthase [Actinotignum schaalii]WQN45181.1 dihydrodipicolinate synthase family protein [Actinotignum schaalii]
MLSGVYCPSVTLIDDSGAIDYPAMAAHIDRLAESGLNGVLFFGSIGEFFSFSTEEKAEFLKFAVKQAAGRFQVLAGVSAARLGEVLENIAAAEAAGVDGVVALPPFYFGHSHGRALDFYDAVAGATQLPVMLYNFPERTGADLTPELVAELAARHENIVALKDTVDTQSHTRRVIREVKKVRPDFAVLSGFDEYYIGNRVCGGAGVLSGLTNLIPEVFAAMHAAYEAGDVTRAAVELGKITRLAAVYEIGDIFIAAIKEGVRLCGVECSPLMRAPQVPLSAEDSEKIAQLLREVHA